MKNGCNQTDEAPLGSKYYIGLRVFSNKVSSGERDLLERLERRNLSREDGKIPTDPEF